MEPATAERSLRNTVPSPKTLLTLAEGARKCRISEQALLTHATEGLIDLCVLVPPRHRVYSVSRVHVGLPEQRTFNAVLCPDLVVPHSYPDASALLLTKATCELVLATGNAHQEFAPAAVEGVHGESPRTVFLKDLQAIPGREERLGRYPFIDNADLSAWNSTDGCMPEAAASSGLNELSYLTRTQGVAFSLDQLQAQKVDPWSVIDGRGRRQYHQFEQWFAAYPDKSAPGVDSFTGIPRPATISVTPQFIHVTAEELERFLAQKMAVVRRRREHEKPSTFDGVANASDKLRKLDVAGTRIWGKTRPTDDSFMSIAEVAQILQDDYDFPEYMAKSAASIIEPDYAEKGYSIFKRVMMGRTFRSLNWDALTAGYEEFWAEAGDVTLSENCESNATVMAWFQEVHSFPEDMARHAAIIIRPDNAAKSSSDAQDKGSKKKR